ncbi:MAG: beta-galactosidase [Dysgonamonadaceae bacterium]|nr:beta-galactosidase [Dysgonamonadaceae bacterium]
MGTDINPKGETIRIDSRSLLWNGRPVLPVMGEIHFSRLPEKEWQQELLKMKAGGINIIASYIFWIHHEEVQGEYNWSGQRNLNHFVQLCNELDFKLILRIGPWCHGEVRNGGFPEWMVGKNFRLRENNPDYLNEVRTWYNQIYRQVKGQLWKDGGPIIGIQIENEYRGRWEHLATLKRMAIESGFDVPLYTRTGWPQLGSPAVFGEIIPLYGDYADGFWDRSLQEMPGDYSKSFLFRPFRSSTVIATEQLPGQPDKDAADAWAYPYFTCELGGGMMPSYHRRISIHPMDVYAMTLVRIGSGSNLPGYYMYHGGTNPDGILTTLNEEQATGMTNYNDLPVKTYDFQAPLGEFGQVNGQYHRLRRLHLFLHDYGGQLALMNPYFPAEAPEHPDDDSSLRWNVRYNGKSGFVFVNNYQRLKTLSRKDNVRFTIDLPEEKLTFPESPVSVSSGSAFFMPFNLRMGEATLKYATAQPIAYIAAGNELTFFFAEIPGIPADFVFDDMRFMNLKTGKEKAISFRDTANQLINIVLLDEESSLALWKGKLSGKDRVFLTDTNVEVIYHNNELRLSTCKDSIAVSIYPAPESLRCEDQIPKGVNEGIFTRYTVKVHVADLPKIELKQIKKHERLRQIAMGSAKVAESPKDKDFEQAAAWQITFPPDINPERDIYLQIPYTGDVARIYSGNQLLTDNFYNGKVFELSLKRFAPEIYAKDLILQILPLQKEAPIYFQSDISLDFAQADHLIDLPEIRIYEKKQIILRDAK